jgi:intracellular multiplication protein IcmX
MKKTMKQLALSTVVIALSSLSLSAYSADKLKAGSGAGDAGSLTQIAAQIYGQMKAGYAQANARLQQVDDFLNSYILSATTPVIPQVSTAVAANAVANPTLAQPVSMPLVVSTVQAANSKATTNNVMGQITTNAMTYSTGKNPNNAMYLPWYNLFIDNSPTGSLLSDPKSPRVNSSAQYLNNLTVYLPASDSFLVPPVEQAVSQVNNNYFDFMNYFAPASGAYNPNPMVPNANSNLKMARGYPEFLTLSNQPVADDLSWVLTQYELNGQISPVHLSQLADVMKGENYQNSYKKFLLSERQYNAARSMVNGLMSQVWVERAPVKGAAAPVLTESTDPKSTQQKYFTPGDKTLSASPLQMERYIRTHRVNDSSWYQKMSTASPATVAREQLYVSAQLLAAQQQAHEDREKLLLATLLNSQGYVNGTMKTNLGLSERSLKSDLCKALGKDGGAICSGVGAKATAKAG